MRKGGVVVALVLPLLVGTLSAESTWGSQVTSTSLPAEESDAEESDWVGFDYDYELKNSVTFILRGQIEDGACHFTGSGDIHNANPMEERSVSINLVDCVMLMERGEPPAVRVLPDEGWETASETLVHERAPLSGQTGGEAATCCFQAGSQTGGVRQDYSDGATVRKFAYHKTYWEDPPQLDVNSVESQIDWTSDGTCANLGRTRYRTRWAWRSGTGWSRQSKSHSGERACNYATTVSKAKYFNGVFCTGQDIWAHYDGSVSITGLSNGRYSMTWDVWLESDSALCSALLSFHRKYGYFTSWPENH